LRIAEEVLADVELKRLKASEVVLKASRLARLVGHSQLIDFLAWERDGYRGDGTDNYWIGRAGRWLRESEDKFFPTSIAKIESEIDATRQALGTLGGGGNYSGEYASVAAREHDQKITSYSTLLATYSGISGQVVATVYSIVTEIYHELLFSELQATLFAATQARLDGALAASSRSALEKM